MIFFGRDAWCHVCNTCTYLQKISHLHVFLEKDLLSPPVQRKNITFSGKKNRSFQIIQEIMFQRNFFEKTIFSEHLKKISYVFFFRSYVFLDIFFRLRGKIIFPGKWNIIFPDSTWNSIAIFLERPSFQGVCKKKMWFPVQWNIQTILTFLKYYCCVSLLKYKIIFFFMNN